MLVFYIFYIMYLRWHIVFHVPTQKIKTYKLKKKNFKANFVEKAIFRKRIEYF